MTEEDWKRMGEVMAGYAADTERRAAQLAAQLEAEHTKATDKRHERAEAAVDARMREQTAATILAALVQNLDGELHGMSGTATHLVEEAVHMVDTLRAKLTEKP